MNKAILARNLLILAQVERIAALLRGRSLPAVLLKGAALIAAVPDYAGERLMEDIDLLVEPGRLAETRAALEGAGYVSSPDEPSTLAHPEEIVRVDLSDHLWYLDAAENRAVFEESRRHPAGGLSPILYHLEPVDFYVHVLAHAAVHHGRAELKWIRDLEVIRERWGESLAREELDRKLERFGLSAFEPLFRAGGRARGIYRLILAWEHPLKGHVLRFACLPAQKKTGYLFRTLFPPADFIRHRYSLNSGAAVAVYRIARPFLLAARLVSLPLRPLLHR